jgi:hypothetical protein
VTTEALDLPVVAGDALRSANFFNGRLLTGEDLRREQETTRARLQRVGRAAGAGVAYGLEVSETIGTSTKSRPVVTVAAGLAVSRSGETVELGAPIDLGLAREAPTAQSEPGALFADCQPFAPGTYTAGAGVYLLTIARAEQGEGRAPVSGLANEPAPCNVALSVEAVRFRLIRLALPAAELAGKERLRNRVAYRFFAPDAGAAFVRDPFARAPDPTLLDTLRDQTLHEDEVPLAVVGWSVDDGIQFVDLWAVRRRITRGSADTLWPIVAGEGPEIDGEARLLQFEEHVADLALRDPSPPTLEARSHFGELPGAGLVPVGAEAFDVGRFFAGLTVRGPLFIEGAKLAALLRLSLGYPPVSVAGPEAVWLYVVRENVQASSSGDAGQVVAFANGHMPYAGDARFDLSYWNFANFALRAT